MSREMQDVDLAEVKPLVEKGETITSLLQEFDVQTKPATIPSSTTRTCRRSPSTSPSATWTPLASRTAQPPSPQGTCTPPWISWLKCFLESFNSLGKSKGPAPPPFAEKPDF
uniref:N-myc downstream regulated 1 n=1 Tax=Colobus angolensis palliatus TaxID=336983 RepID=A0A2K5IW87_COLAP